MRKESAYFQELIEILISICLASIGLKAFLLPNGFLDGGVTGIAILISTIFGLDISIALVLVTIPFLVLGWFTISKRILVKSIISIILLAIIIHFENFGPITEDKLLISIFGGIFLGSGIGLAIKNGTVLDGAEILGLYVNQKIGLSIGTTILLFNTILFSITALTISVEVALYSILAFFVTGKVIDLALHGFEDYVGLWVISESSNIIQEKLMSNIKTGVTIYNGSRGIGRRGLKKDIEIIQILLNRIDANKAYRIIEGLDKNAFIVEFDVNRIKGGFLKSYLPKIGT